MFVLQYPQIEEASIRRIMKETVIVGRRTSSQKNGKLVRMSVANEWLYNLAY